MTDTPKEHHVYRPGQWLPEDSRVHREWLEKTIKHVDNNPKELHPVIQEFQAMIDDNPRLRVLFTTMFEQLPAKKPYRQDPAGKPQVRDYTHMLRVLNHIIQTAPGWSDRSFNAGTVGVPVQALFDWPMGTASGFAVFLDPQVNAMLKKVLNVWGEYLQSPESAGVLDTSTGGWFGQSGNNDLADAANSAASTSHKFEDLFVCDKDAKYYGFTSWDNFFTRLFREGVRPVASPQRDDVIVNACESVPYKVAHHVKGMDKFWIKGQPYSVKDMLAGDELWEQFVGGTIYQAFLSALSYHRWHSPVSGKIVKAYVIDGTYYSEPLFTGLTDQHGPDPDGENIGQEYISAVATRAPIFIQADNPDIGLVCMLAIGMVEVSTCDITVKAGQHVKKGDQLGMFHFGGSTHCVLFEKGVKLKGFPHTNRKANLPVRSELCRVVKG